MLFSFLLLHDLSACPAGPFSSPSLPDWPLLGNEKASRALLFSTLLRHGFSACPAGPFSSLLWPLWIRIGLSWCSLRFSVVAALGTFRSLVVICSRSWQLSVGIGLS